MAEGGGEILRYVAGPGDAGRALRSLLRGQLGVSRTLLTRLKAAQGVLINGRPQWVDYRLQPGDEVQLFLPENPSAGFEPEDLPLDLVYEDPDLLVVDKPPGQLVHPVKKEQHGTLANAVAWRWQQQGWRAPVRPLHRLDRDTSGLVLFARDPWVYGHLLRQLEGRALEREYRALVLGRVDAEAGEVAAPIAPVPGSHILHGVDPSGRPALTHYVVLQRWPQATLLSLRLQTGRTHQIRVHMAWLGHPVLGDRLYGQEPSGGLAQPPRQMLHAARLGFRHPRSGATLEFISPLPSDMLAALATLASPEHLQG